MSETAISSPDTNVILGASNLIGVLRERAPRVAFALAAWQLMWPLGIHIRKRSRERTIYTVKVSADDEIYNDLHDWVLSLLPPTKQRALEAWTSNRGHLAPISSSGQPAPAPKLRLRYDGTRAQTICVGGHKVSAMVMENKEKKQMERTSPEITFTVHSPEAQKALLDEISQISDRHYQQGRKPSFRMMSRYGDWETLESMPQRGLDSVVLPPGQLDYLVADVQRFLNNEKEYVRRNIPWHRAHLYEGPPGTGKTSAAHAIASHFGMDVWYLPLADIKKDGDLLRLITRVGPRSMLLLEDIDVFHAATKRNDADSGVTLSGLLNALDGVASPHGLFSVLTTNDPQVLDHAVIRPGRVDLVEHFSLADPPQVAELIAHWYALPGAGQGYNYPQLSPAQVSETCKRYDLPEDAIAELMTLTTPSNMLTKPNWDMLTSEVVGDCVVKRDKGDV